MKNFLLKIKYVFIATLIVIAYLFVPSVVKASNVMVEASEILSQATEKLDNFLDLNVAGTYKEHAEEIKPLLDRINTLTASYENDTTQKGIAIYKILKKLDSSLEAIYSTLSKDYNLSLTLGLALRNTVNKYLSSGEINELKTNLNELKPLLNTDEQKDLDALLEKLKSFSVKMPQNPLSLLSKRIRG